MTKKAKIIPANEHVFIAGRTGSGKTFMAKKYLANYDNVVAIDTKGLLSWPEIPDTMWRGQEKEILVNNGKNKNLTIVTKLEALENVNTPKIIYRPEWDELNEEFYNAFFKWVYMRKNTIVWVDEAMSICPSPFKIPEYYKAILTRGRQRQTAVWSLTQRPSGIPQIIMSESTHFFVFDLNLPQDREKLVEVTGARELYAKPGKYVFWYYHVENDQAFKAKLVERSD
jgi:hypothetical protein